MASLAAAAIAQPDRITIARLVVDPAGAAVPNARAPAVNQSTGTTAPRQWLVALTLDF